MASLPLLRRAALVAAVAAVAWGCSSPGEVGDAPSATSGGGPVTDSLDFVAAAVSGEGEISGADYAGSDVALWFWAPW